MQTCCLNKLVYWPQDSVQISNKTPPRLLPVHQSSRWSFFTILCFGKKMMDEFQCDIQIFSAALLYPLRASIIHDGSFQSLTICKLQLNLHADIFWCGSQGLCFHLCTNSCDKIHMIIAINSKLFTEKDECVKRWSSSLSRSLDAAEPLHKSAWLDIWMQWRARCAKCLLCCLSNMTPLIKITKGGKFRAEKGALHRNRKSLAFLNIIIC